MKKVLSFALAVLMAVAVLPLWLLPTVAYDNTTNTPVQGLEREITEASEYRTLQNTLYKLETDKELTIAFIGDSIGCGQKPSPTSTLGIDGIDYSSRLTGTTVHQKYANVIYEWFQWYAEDVLQVEVDVNAIYSNWGGQTLKAMMSYINETVLVHTPDLVIIEAWNVTYEADGTKSGAYYLESMIQQIYATNPYADIMILDMGGDIVSNTECKAVWEHYNIPVVLGMTTLGELTFNNRDMWDGGGNPAYSFTNDKGIEIPPTGLYFYNGGWPHVNEEAYAFVNMLFTNSVLKLFEEAKEGDLYGQYTIVQPDTKRIVFNDDGTVKSYPTDTYHTSEGLFGGLFYRSDIIFADEFTYDSEIWTLNGTKPDITKLYDAYSVVQGQYLSTSTTGASFTFDFYGSAFMVYGKSGSYTIDIDGTTLENSNPGYTISASDEDAQHTVTITMTGTGSIYCVSTFAHTYTAPQKVERENEYYVNFFGKILDEYVHDNTYNDYAIIPNPLQWIAFGRSRVYEGTSVQVPTSSIIHEEAYDASYGNFVGWVEADDVTFVNGNKIPTVNEYKYENGEIIDVATGEPKKVYCAGQYIDATRDMDLVAVYSNSDEYSAKTVNYASSVDSSEGFLPQLSSDRAQENYVNGVDITSTSDKAEFTFEELYRNGSHTYGFSGVSKKNTYWYYDAETDTVSSMNDKWWASSPYYINTRNSQSVSRVQKDDVLCVRIERTAIGTTNGYSDFVPYIVLPGANVTIGESVFVTVKYYYDTTNSTGNLVGKQMMLTLNCELGSDKYSFSTASNETIVGDQWATLTFDFTGKYIYYGKDVFNTVKEVALSASALTYAGVPTNVGTHQGTDNSRNGDVVYIGDFIYNCETPTLEVTYTNSGKTVKTETSQGEPVVLPSAIDGMVNEGYQLIGWTDGTNTYDVGASETFYEDVTLEAVWAKIYNVTVYDGAGNSKTYTTIDKITLPDADEFTKENSGIIGWTDGEATYAPGQTITVTGDMNLEAVWETSYTVKFYNGTTLISESVIAGSVTLPAAPEAEGEAVFLGWSDGNGNTFNAGATVELVGDTTFTAKWMDISDKMTVNYADYYSKSSEIYDAWIAFARNHINGNITENHFTEWGETTTSSKPWYQKYDEETDTQYIGNDRWWGTSYIAWYNFLIFNDEATIDGVKGVSVKRYQLTYNNSTTSGGNVLDNGLGTEAEKAFTSYYLHMPMPVPSGITYEYAKVVTVKYYYDPANDAATNLVGKQARLDVKMPNGTVYGILSEETIVANQWSTLTFTLVGTLFDSYGNAQYNTYKDTDISAMSLIVDTTINTMKTNDVFYVSEASFDKNFDIKMDHSVSFKNNLTLNYYVPDSEFDSCYSSKGDTLLADSLVLTVEKDVYDRNGNKTVETTTITDYTQETIDGKLYYKFVYDGIAATEVGNEIRASITFDTVSAKNIKTTYTSNFETYSVKTYAYNRLENSTNDTFKTLLVDTLNYCAAAQTYFGYRTDALVNADLTEEQKALGTQTDVEVQKNSSVETNENATASVYGISVVFNSNVEMKFYMDMGEQDLTNVVLRLTYVVDGVETVKDIPATEFIVDQGYYTAKLTDLAAAELFEDVKIVILDGETAISDTVTYNVETYIYNRLSASSKTSFKDLLKNLAKYAASAKAYFIEAQ